MATLAGWRGVNGDALTNLPVVGSRLVMAYARATLVAADDTAGTLAITFPNMRSITGFWVTILGSGNNLVGSGEIQTDTTGADLTVSGNVLTIADGQSQWVLTAGDIIHVLVVGPSKL
jgi:hypothetical protein